MKKREGAAGKAAGRKVGAGSATEGAKARPGRAAGKKVADAKPEKYKMKEKLLAIGDDFWIETESGRKAFKVDGKLLSVRDKLSFEDNNGHELAFIRSQFFSVRDRIGIERVGGSSAQLKKDLIDIVHDHFTLEFDDGDEIDVRGNILDHEYTFRQGNKKIGEVSKKWFRIADSYGVEVDGGEDHIMFLAACVALDQSAHDGPIDV
ncbi:MAG: LURP-one-related family protein [Chloroflexota bacterium]